MSWKLSDASSPSTSRRNRSIPDHLRRNPKSDRLSRPLMDSCIDPDALIRYVDSSISTEEYAQSSILVSAELPSSSSSSKYPCWNVDDDKTSWVGISCDIQSLSHQTGVPSTYQTDYIKPGNGPEKSIIDSGDIKQESGMLRYSLKSIGTRENGLSEDDAGTDDKQESGVLEDEMYEKKGKVKDRISFEGKQQNGAEFDGKNEINVWNVDGNITEKQQNGVEVSLSKDAGNIEEKQQNGVRTGLSKDGNNIEEEQQNALRSSCSKHGSGTAEKQQNGVFGAECDARTADEAYRAACSALSEGDAASALSLLIFASSKCPPDRHSALGKVQRLTVTAMQLLEKKSTNLKTLSHEGDDSIVT